MTTRVSSAAARGGAADGYRGGAVTPHPRVGSPMLALVCRAPRSDCPLPIGLATFATTALVLLARAGVGPFA